MIILNFVFNFDDPNLTFSRMSTHLLYKFFKNGNFSWSCSIDLLSQCKLKPHREILTNRSHRDAKCAATIVATTLLIFSAYAVIFILAD